MSGVAVALRRAINVAADPEASTRDVDLAIAEMKWRQTEELDDIHQATLARRLYRFCHGETT